MMKNYIVIIYLIIISILISPVLANGFTNGYYTIPIHASSNSPGDAVSNFIGFRPTTPALVSGHNIFYFPTSGTIEAVMIYEYSGTAGTSESYSYYVRINDATDYLVKTLAVATSERVFNNDTIRVSVNAGDYFEIKRVHPTWSTNPATNVVGGYILFNSTENGYIIPIQQLSSSPADAATNYMGHRPIATSTSQGTNKIYVPSGGNITKAYIMDNSTGNSTAEGISYFISVSGGDERRINTLNINSTSTPGSTLLRQFNNTNLQMNIDRGDYIEVKRLNPTWVYNPLTDIVSGSLFVNTSISRDVNGYMLFVDHLTASTTDGQTIYYGTTLSAPITTAGRNKVFVPINGIINKVELYTYSGTAGTAEPWSVYLQVNGSTDYLIKQVNSSAGERLFKNNTMNISVRKGNYLEIKSINPTWATNPATMITGGYIWVDYSETSSGGDVILPPVSNFSANLTSSPIGSTIKFFDQSNNTIPGTTTYYWNFIDGGTAVNSTDQNPTFSYAESGTYTINHTVSSGGITSKSTGIITIYIPSGSGSGTKIPAVSFKLVLTDTSTEFPTSWKWNATNLTGNNTEVTFSTSQDPDFNFGPGNWRINFTATNAFGSNTTNQTIGYNITGIPVKFWNRTA